MLYKRFQEDLNDLQMVSRRNNIEINRFFSRILHIMPRKTVLESSKHAEYYNVEKGIK